MDIAWERFDSYRGNLQALKIEFLNLPVELQERFLPVIDRFAQDCRRLLDEARSVKERKVRFVVDNLEPLLNRTHIKGKIIETGNSVIVALPSHIKVLPKIGDELIITLFSLDGNIWYSSKEELITGR